MRPPALAGVGLAVACAFCYGVTVVFGRVLAQAGLGPSTVLGVRFAMGAVLLVPVLIVVRAPLVPARGERIAAFALGAVGYALQATLFYMGLQRGTAAAVTLLFYAFPAIVVLLQVPIERKLPGPATVAALVASLAGAAIIVATSGDVHVTRAGAVLALAAGTIFAFYVLAGNRTVVRSHPLTSAVWVCAGTAAALFAHGVATGAMDSPQGWWWHLAANGLATAVAFACLFAALRRLGPSSTSVIMTLEAFFAILLAAIFIGETVGGWQVAGGAAIIGGAVLIAVSTRSPIEDPRGPAPQP